MTYRRFFLFVAAGWSLGAACAGEVEPGPGAGGLGGEAGSAVGGGPTTGGSASGGTGGGHPDSGGTGGTTTGEGGFGGQGPVRPEPGEVVEGSLDELTEMDCVIELDDQADGTVEQRWGIDYFGDQIERKLIWEQASEDVTVVYFDEDERPWLACWPQACRAIPPVEEKPKARLLSRSTVMITLRWTQEWALAPFGGSLLTARQAALATPTTPAVAPAISLAFWSVSFPTARSRRFSSP